MRIISGLLGVICLLGLIITIWACCLGLLQGYGVLQVYIIKKYLIGTGLISFAVALTAALIAAMLESLIGED